jgi:PKHD-type hydroxylase
MEIIVENLFLPEIDYEAPAEFNMQTYSYWPLRNDTLEEYRYIEDVFSEQEIKEIIKIGKSYQKDVSKTADGTGFSETRKSKNSWIPPSKLTFWIFNRIQKAIEEVNKHFEFDLNSIENLQFTEYDSNYSGNYKKHIDKFSTPVSPNSHRKLSFSIQLTDPSMYEGGELVIYNGTEIVANNKKATFNSFPSYTLHEVKPVLKGKRYSLVGWCSGPKFK